MEKFLYLLLAFVLLLSFVLFSKVATENFNVHIMNVEQEDTIVMQAQAP